jgi:hypothetical protein
MKVLITLAALAFLALIIVRVWREDPRPQIDPRSFHCDRHGRLPCDGMGQ